MRPESSVCVELTKALLVLAHCNFTGLIYLFVKNSQPHSTRLSLLSYLTELFVCEMATLCTEWWYLTQNGGVLKLWRARSAIRVV